IYRRVSKYSPKTGTVMPRERSHRRRQRRQKNEMNVVPYIDVMLVLLVIFMVTAPMITPGIIDLPTVGEASEVPATPVEVQLGEDGVLSVRLREASNDFSPSSPESLIDDIQAIAKIGRASCRERV